ncbi:homoserine O-acetyltransferase [Campylobacter avium LMG 24591]|uniref:Homoserine O-acetyltransferase n=1 Tax=Campylobacter avium LMG 24591 TaxID=522484 RepID=A0A222MZ84_9BACT|nr:homoserine O-succinyltransferase [Campylobacter avium]ASQ31307.1 homoserine O-acetyltransferase [Campylobacter avium LMG 24591]OYD79981.1 homoserine O-acetyltransferase [Campylobacter avium]HJE65965.1 homoserine O-succinyltransferase [Campylobacter avium]
MPVIIPKEIPAFKELEKSVFVMDTQRANTQDIRALKILIFNLMPTKIQTENQLLSLLANSPLQIDISLLSTQSYVGKNTPALHLDKFYKGIDDVKDKKFDGAIVTGAPIELLSYEEVKYWNEFKTVLDFLRKNVTSTMYICWGAMAALYYFYGIRKKVFKDKLSGIYKHKILHSDLLLTNSNDEILMPHSRYARLKEKDIAKHKDLKILLSSKKTGAALLKDEKDVFVLGHPEYFKDTLKLEYERDLSLGLKIKKPCNYFKKNSKISYSWRCDANNIFANWLNYSVYQATPYDIE